MVQNSKTIVPTNVLDIEDGFNKIELSNIFKDIDLSGFLILTGTSFSGKSTMQDLILKLVKNSVVFQTCTTRKEREYEKGLPYWAKPYHFYSKEEFKRKIANNDFFEYEMIEKGEGNFDYYGTCKADIQAAIDSKNRLYVAVLEPNGAKKIADAFDGVKVIFIAPPSLEVLKERALGRNTEKLPDISARLKRAETFEISFKDDFDGCVVNTTVTDCLENIKNILKKG